MERKRRLQERSMSPNNLVRRLRDCEDENMVLRLDLENLNADLKDCEMVNKALNGEMQGLKRERALCRREHGNTVRTDREEFAAQLKAEQEEKRVLRKQNEELRKQLKEQAMKLKACETDNKSPSKKGEEEVLLRENEEMKECKEMLQSAHELAMKNMVCELKAAHDKQMEEQTIVIRKLTIGMERQRENAADLRREAEGQKEMLQKLKDLAIKRKAENTALREQNDDFRKEVKDFTEKLHSAPEGLAMKNKVREMEEAHRKEVEELTALQKKIASSTVNLAAKLKEQNEDKEALHQEKKALQRKVEELTEMLEKERNSSYDEQTIKLKALELKTEELKKLCAEEAFTTKNLSIKRKAEKEKEALRQKMEEHATQLKVEEVENEARKSNNREAEVGGSGEEELPKKTKKPSMFRRFAKLFTSNKRKEKKKEKKKEKMESA